MKIILILILFCGALQICNAQDTLSLKYYPMKIGNKWIYNHNWYYSGNTKVTNIISDTLIVNGHKYFKLHSQNPPPGSGYTDQYIRVDSVTGSLRMYVTSGACPWLINEQSLDSFKTHYPDSLIYDCSFLYKAGRDTSYMFFGQIRSIKTYNWTDHFEQDRTRSFAYGLGMIYNYYGGPPYSSTHLTILGCVIDGIVYGDTSLTGLTPVSSEIPDNFSLSQNYPNPFNPSTKIKFNLPVISSPLKGESTYGAGGMTVHIVVYDILGREVTTLVNEALKPGSYEVEWPAPTGDAGNFASGIYFYSLQTK